MDAARRSLLLSFWCLAIAPKVSTSSPSGHNSILPKGTRRLDRSESKSSRTSAISTMHLKAALSTLLVMLATFCLHGFSSTTEVSGAIFTSDGKLRLPSDYREWMYVSTGLGMSYRDSSADHEPSFDNVFVQRDAYREFTRTRVWPTGTMFILELRRSSDHGSILKAGRFQTEVVSIEASVKDGRRFANKWAYFDFGSAVKEAAPLPDSQCLSCHRQNAAIDNTFIQFYPALLDRLKTPDARPR